jgi:pilus assembly protein CpaF
MSLRDRLVASQPAVHNPSIAELRGGVPQVAPRLQPELKQRVHQTLLDRIDLARLQKLSSDRVSDEIRAQVGALLEEEDVVLNDLERRQLVTEIQNEMLGFGPLETLLADSTVADILVNGSDNVFVEREGRLERSPVRFDNDEHLMKIIEKIASRVGRRVDESSPMVDARLPDGSRVNAVIPPLALDGPILSIRKFSRTPLRMDDLIRFKSIPEPLSDLIRAMVGGKLNVIISGGTGSGKTTLLNILSSYISDRERIITIEDAAELQLQQSHVVRLETRPPNMEGRGEVNQRALVRNALRMRPDRIILGEVRGAEVIDMLQAMNTGHDGSIATIHANTPRDALTRIEAMLSMSDAGISVKAMRQQIASAISIVVQVNRLSDGKRKVVSVQEVTGMESDAITMHEIWGYRQTGVSPDGHVLGYFSATGIRPRFLEKVINAGFAISEDLFDPSRRFV